MVVRYLVFQSFGNWYEAMNCSGGTAKRVTRSIFFRYLLIFIIHANLFLTTGWQTARDLRNDSGVNFCALPVVCLLFGTSSKGALNFITFDILHFQLLHV